jgi:type II secretory pathway component PulC
MNALNSISSSRLWQRHGTLIAWLFGALCLALVIASVGWDAYQQRTIRAQNYAPQQLAPIQQATRTTYQARTIVRANLFGSEVVKVKEKPIVKTTLNLKLQGILWDSNGGMARAIITSGNKKAELYAVGEQIKGAGASVKEIRSAEVLLNRGGATESLPLVVKKAEELEPFLSQQASFVSRGNAPQQFRENTTPNEVQRKPHSTNGAPRKIRRPNFNGLDKALRKMGEI